MEARAEAADVPDLRVAALLAATPHDAEHLLPLLLAVQAALGHVPPASIPAIAEAFGRSRSEVYAVVTFYKDLRTAPVGRTVVQLCMAEACQAVGCRALAAHAEARLGVAMDGTTADGRVHLEATYCLGNCALGPAVRVGDDVHGLVSAERLDALLDTLQCALPDALPDSRSVGVR
ncbi:MAG: NAD(P)H-dependent oxidoreductase subunit E [Gemmatimonadetes bacterium]|nr:NAD(P)H-dependent oxidoreductase subunit E [Gemmatimonadota bacterium]